MTSDVLCTAIVATLCKRKLDRSYTLAIASGDDEIQAAHAALEYGVIDGYVSVTSSPAGLLITISASSAELDEKLALAIDSVAVRFGGRSQWGGQA